MSETLIILVLALFAFLLFRSARDQRRKSRVSRKKIVDRAWRRDEK